MTSPLSSANPAPSGLAQGNTLIAFILLCTLAGIGVGLCKVGTALYALELQASPLLLGLIASAQTAGLLLTSLPCGVLVERFGPLRLFCGGSLVAASLFLLTPLVPHPLYLLALTLLVGLCMPCRFVSLNTLFMQQLAQIGESRAGWFRGSQMIGLLLIGPSLAALLSEWRGAAGIWPLVALAFALPLLLAPWVLRLYPAKRAGAEPLSFAAVGRLLALPGQDAQLRGTCLLDFFVQAAAQFFAFFIIAITVQDHGWSAQEAALLLTGHGAAFILALFLLGRLVSGNGYGLLLALGAAMAALVTLAYAELPPALWTGGVLLGLSLGMLQVTTLSRYARSGLRLGHGRIAGLAALVGPAGGMSGGLVGGLLGKSLGLQPLFLIFVLPFALFALARLYEALPTLFVRRTLP